MRLPQVRVPRDSIVSQHPAFHRMLCLIFPENLMPYVYDDEGEHMQCECGFCWRIFFRSQRLDRSVRPDTDNNPPPPQRRVDFKKSNMSFGRGPKNTKAVVLLKKHSAQAPDCPAPTPMEGVVSTTPQEYARPTSGPYVWSPV